jgi:hypothetical protein
MVDDFAGVVIILQHISRVKLLKSCRVSHWTLSRQARILVSRIQTYYLHSVENPSNGAQFKLMAERTLQENRVEVMR